MGWRSSSLRSGLKRDCEFVLNTLKLEDEELGAYVEIITALLKAERDAAMGEGALGDRVEWPCNVDANNVNRMEKCLWRFVRRDGCPLVQLVARDFWHA